MRPIRAFALTGFGAVAGFAGAAAVAKRALPSRGDESSDELALVAIFDGIDLKSRAAAFRGGSVLAWFGGVALDLREAALAPDAHLSVHALFGGIAIRVPRGLAARVQREHASRAESTCARRKPRARTPPR